MSRFSDHAFLVETDRMAVELVRRLERLERRESVRWFQTADLARRVRGSVVAALADLKRGETESR